MQCHWKIVTESDASSKPWMLKQGCSVVALSSLHTVLEHNSLVTHVWHLACLHQVSNQHEVTTFWPWFFVQLWPHLSGMSCSQHILVHLDLYTLKCWTSSNWSLFRSLRVRVWSSISTLKSRCYAFWYFCEHDCIMQMHGTGWRKVFESLLWRHANRQIYGHARENDKDSPSGVKGKLFNTQANSRSMSTHWPACCMMFSHRKSVCAKPAWCNTSRAWSIHLHIHKLM